MSLVPIDKLTPHPLNARNGDVDFLRGSLEMHGQYRAIVVQASTMRVLAGHHVYFAALELGFEEIEADVLDVDDDEALRILTVDNRSADLGVTNPHKLPPLLEAAGGVEGTGYTQNEVDAIVAAAAADDPWATDLDDDDDEPDDEDAPAGAGDPDPDDGRVAPSSKVEFRLGEFKVDVDIPTYLDWLNRIELSAPGDEAGEVQRRLGLG